jgi:hypothetical protein
VSPTGRSAHMWCMANLHADLRKVIDRHRASSNEEVQDLLLDLEIVLDDAGTPEYQYRHHPTWDDTWIELDESQTAVVLEHGHAVERRIVGDWEAVMEATK